MAVVTTPPKAAMDKRTCLLGGESQTRSLLGAGLSMAQWGAVAGTVALDCVAVMITRSWIAVVVGAAVSGGLWLGLRHHSSEGDPWSSAWWSARRYARERRTGRNVTTEGTVPEAVGHVSFLVHTTPATPAPLLVLRHENPATPTHYTATMEVTGMGGGLREVAEVNRQGRWFGELLYELSRTAKPVDTVSVLSRSVPLDPAQYRNWLAERMVPSAPAIAREALWELADATAGTAEEHRAYVTLRLPASAVAERAREQGRSGTDGQLGVVLATLAEVARFATEHGLAVRQALGPARWSSLVRHLYLPDQPLDADDDIAPETCWPATTNERQYVIATDGDKRWFHAVASVPKDAWPMRDVGVRWLEPLVAGIDPPMVRSVISTFRLTPRLAARKRAKGDLVVDEADVRSAQMAGKVTDGTSNAQAAATQQRLHDLLHEAAAGCSPQMHVVVSAPSAVALGAARVRMEAAAQDIDIARLRWWDGRHAQAMALGLPLARGAR